MGHLFHQHVTADSSHFHNYTLENSHTTPWTLGKKRKTIYKAAIFGVQNVNVPVDVSFQRPAQDKAKGRRFMVKHSSHLCKS